MNDEIDNAVDVIHDHILIEELMKAIGRER